MAKGILIAAMDFTDVAEDEFNDWYDLEHLPERQRVPGFLACERWIGAHNPKISVASYELDNVEVLTGPGYRAIGGENLSVWSKRVTRRVKMLVRYEGEQILPGDQVAPTAAGALLVNAMNVLPEHQHEFNEWYNTEHIPALAAVPGTLCARRYRGTGAAQRYVALYHLASPDVPDSVAWKKAANTPWTERMRPHFRDHLRIVSRRYTRTKRVGRFSPAAQRRGKKGDREPSAEQPGPQLTRPAVAAHQGSAPAGRWRQWWTRGSATQAA